MNRTTLLLTLFFFSQSISAEEEHIQHGAHQHGVTALEIAQDANQLEVGLYSPAYNLVGFEHQPGNEMQKQQVAETLDTLKAPERFLCINPESGCEFIGVDVETPLASHQDRSMNTNHEHEHEHQENEHAPHVQAGDAARHSDIQAHYRLLCADPAKLDWLEVDLFAHYPLIEEIHAQIITSTIQREMKLIPGTVRIPLSE